MNRLNELIEKEKQKLDLSEIFDLTKIPEEELRRQHYDVSLVHSFSGYGSPLLKIDNDYIS